MYLCILYVYIYIYLRIDIYIYIYILPPFFSHKRSDDLTWPLNIYSKATSFKTNYVLANLMRELKKMVKAADFG